MDTPPHVGRDACSATELPALVVVWVQPTQADLWAAGATSLPAEAAEVHARLVLNCVPPRARLMAEGQ